MNKKITIVLSGAWVLGHRKDDVLPIQFLIGLVKEQYTGSLNVVHSNLTEVQITVNSDEDAENLSAKLREAFCARYELDPDASNVITLTVEDVAADNSSSADKSGESDEGDECDEGVESDKPADGEVKKTETEDGDSDAVFTKGGSVDDDDEDKTDADDDDDDEDDDDRLSFMRGRREKTPKVEPPEKVMARIDGLIGAEEFKALAEEIHCIAPQIVENQRFDIFSSRAFVISINAGYGLTSYLKELANLMGSLGLRKKLTGEDVQEIALSAPKADSMEPFEPVAKLMLYASADHVKLLCVDVSEWMNSLNTTPFRSFLNMLAEHMDEYVIVFRVPFVDKDVLERVSFALNDLMYVRVISCPPFNNSDLRKYAAREMAKYGFHMSPASWSNFDRRIAEEKSDGKFYGLNTVTKVVRELMYRKMLSNAKRGKNELCISKKDTALLCAEKDVGGMTAEQMLDSLVGSESIKTRIFEIVSQIVYARSSGELERPCIHMRFVGNPGTGKTTVARIIGKLLKEHGVLRIGDFHEHAGRDLCGRYIGETAPKTASICRDAYGSVLFLDEAYTLYRGDGNDRDYGREALDTLIAEMENHRDDMVIIMAGYADEMETLMHGNAGLASRMPYIIEFPNFTREQLYQVFVSMMGTKFKHDEALLPAVKTYFDSLPDALLNSKEFSNARFVRNLYERTWAKAAMRCQLSKINEISLTKDDFDRATQDREFYLNAPKKKNRIGFYD